MSENENEKDKSVPIGKEALNQALFDLIGPPAREIGGMLGDQVRVYRYRSAYNILERTKKWAEKKGVKLKQPDLKFLVPFLESASLEEEDSDMSEMWSKLLLNASMHYEQRYEVYQRLLSMVTSDEARLLRSMWERSHHIKVFHYDQYSESFSSSPPTLDYGALSKEITDLEELADREAGEIAFVFKGEDVPNTENLVLNGFLNGEMLQHLESLRLVKNKTFQFIYNEEKSFCFHSRLTPLGFEFVSACEHNDEEEPCFPPS